MPDVLKFPDVIKLGRRWVIMSDFRDLNTPGREFVTKGIAEAYLEWRNARYKPTKWDHVVRIWITARRAGMWGAQGAPKWWRMLPWR